MDTRELRLGNLIELYGGHVVEVINIFEKRLEVHSDVFQFWPISLDGEEEGEASGIRLTEEWLEKLGFERKESPVTEVHPWVDYVKDNVVISMPYFEFSYSYGDDPVEIKYVHSIQNLFFAIKQRELEVKS